MRMPVRAGLAATLAGCVLAAGCSSRAPAGSTSVSYGVPNRGYLDRGVALPERGPGYVRARPGEDTRFGTDALIAALERAAARVAARFPRTPALRVGDLSAPSGGRHQRHGSHRSGRDVDVMFYATDARGVAAAGLGMYAFDRFGVGREVRLEGGDPPSSEVFFFDAARNWQLVRALVLDDAARVQWIFCSYGLKALLLRYGIEHETDSVVLSRAAYVLHQPSVGRPHNDHFHIRVACTPDERLLGCRDYGPVWPWQRHELDKPSAHLRETLDDAALIAALMEPLP